MLRRPADHTLASLATSALQEGWIRSEDTAVVVFDFDFLLERYESLRAAFPGDLNAAAITANPLKNVLSMLAHAGAGAEAASLPEVRIALATDFQPHKIVFDSPAKIRDEIRTALSLGVHLNADSLEEQESISSLM